MPTPDRLYIDIKDRDIIKAIEKENIFNFKNITNKEKFIFAMSIGINVGIDSYLIEKKEAFFLDKDLSIDDKALINACAVSKYGELEVIEDKEKVYNYVQQCAHVGFKILIDEIRQSGFGSFENQYNIKINEIYSNLDM